MARVLAPLLHEHIAQVGEGAVGERRMTTPDRHRSADLSSRITCEGAVGYRCIAGIDDHPPAAHGSEIAVNGEIAAGYGDAVKQSRAIRLTTGNYHTAVARSLEQITQVIHILVVVAQVPAESGSVQLYLPRVRIRGTQAGVATLESYTACQFKPLATRVLLCVLSRLVHTPAHPDFHRLICGLGVSQSILQVTISGDPGSAVTGRIDVVVHVDHLEVAGARPSASTSAITGFSYQVQELRYCEKSTSPAVTSTEMKSSGGWERRRVCSTLRVSRR